MPDLTSLPLAPAADPSSRSDVPVPTMGLFSLNLTVADAQSPSHHRPLHRVQVGVDLSTIEVPRERAWFRRPSKTPMLNAFRRWCWGTTAQHTLSVAILEAMQAFTRQHGTPKNGELWQDPTHAMMVEQCLGLAIVDARERPLDPLNESLGRLMEVQADVSALVFCGLPRPAFTVLYDPLFRQRLAALSEAVRTTLTTSLAHHVAPDAIVLTQHHDDPSNAQAVQRLIQRAVQRQGHALSHEDSHEDRPGIDPRPARATLRELSASAAGRESAQSPLTDGLARHGGPEGLRPRV